VEPAGVRAVSRGAEQQLGDADLERAADRVGARKGTRMTKVRRNSRAKEKPALAGSRRRKRWPESSERYACGKGPTEETSEPCARGEKAALEAAKRRRSGSRTVEFADSF
jgi:hypothetical protein